MTKEVVICHLSLDKVFKTSFNSGIKEERFV